MSTSTSAPIVAYSAAVLKATGLALSQGLNVNTKTSVDVFILLPDPVTGQNKEQGVTVSYTAPTGAKGKVWLNVGVGSATYNQFSVFTNAWYVVAPSQLTFNPALYVAVQASNQITNVTSSPSATTGTVSLTLTDNKFQRFGNTLTGNLTVNLPTTSLQDGMEFEFVRDAATPGAYTLTITDPSSGGKSYVSASNTKSFVKWRATGSAAASWVIVAAGTLP